MAYTPVSRETYRELKGADKLNVLYDAVAGLYESQDAEKDVIRCKWQECNKRFGYVVAALVVMSVCLSLVIVDSEIGQFIIKLMMKSVM